MKDGERGSLEEVHKPREFCFGHGKFKCFLDIQAGLERKQQNKVQGSGESWGRDINVGVIGV